MVKATEESSNLEEGEQRGFSLLELLDRHCDPGSCSGRDRERRHPTAEDQYEPGGECGPDATVPPIHGPGGGGSTPIWLSQRSDVRPRDVDGESESIRGWSGQRYRDFHPIRRRRGWNGRERSFCATESLRGPVPLHIAARSRLKGTLRRWHHSNVLHGSGWSRQSQHIYGVRQSGERDSLARAATVCADGSSMKQHQGHRNPAQCPIEHTKLDDGSLHERDDVNGSSDPVGKCLAMGVSQ